MLQYNPDVGCLPTTGGKEPAPFPNCVQVNEMKSSLKTLFLVQEALLPAAVRLGFHSCIGGCHGCVDLQNNFNFGLESIVDLLAQMHSDQFSYVSKADFFALAATIAVQRGVSISNKERTDGKSCPEPCYDERWGRVDKDSCPGNEFPVSVLSHKGMMSYFFENFNFTPKEVIALMGAHTLGGAHKENSGHSGYWTKGEKTRFDEKYYSNMIDRSIVWKNIDNSLSKSGGSLQANEGYGGSWQFNGTLNGQEKSFMLNTDFEVFYHLDIDADTGKTTCTLNHMCGVDGNCQPENCQPAPTFQQSKTYSNVRNFFFLFKIYDSP